MLSNYEYFDEIITLQETLIDLMFDYIEDKNILLDNIIDKDLVHFKNSVNDTFDINIIYKQSNALHAQFEKPDTIVIFLPKDFHNVTGNQLLRVFLHELSHYFTSRRVPDYIVKRKKTAEGIEFSKRLENRLKNPPSKNIPWNNADKELVKKYLDYVFQSKEMPNFALTFSLAFLENKENIDYFLSDIREVIKRRFEDKITLEQMIEYYNTIGDSDLRLLFQIFYFSSYLKDSRYQRKLVEMKKLIKKYYRRLLIYFR